MNDQELRWQLRQLPKEVEPMRDLWPGIAARLPLASRRPTRRGPWLAGTALAASLALAAILAPRAPLDDARGRDPQVELVQREAEALTREYEAALSELRGAPVPEPLQPTLQVLDRSAVDIREAIAARPGSPYLLQQLQRTYARRLTLTQRAVAG